MTIPDFRLLFDNGYYFIYIEDNMVFTEDNRLINTVYNDKSKLFLNRNTIFGDLLNSYMKNSPVICMENFLMDYSLLNSNTKPLFIDGSLKFDIIKKENDIKKIIRKIKLNKILKKDEKR